MVTRSVRAALLAAAVMLGGWTAPAPAQVAADRGSCGRDCLQGIGESYLAALVAHDARRAPVSADVRYTENGVELRIPDGLWRTASKVGDYRLYVADPETGTVAFFASMYENGSPLLLAARLKIENKLITQIEATISRTNAGLAEGAGLAFPANIDITPRAQFTQALTTAQRRPRKQMIEIANSYFAALENNDGAHVPPFADDCHRLENGIATTDRTLSDPGGRKGSANYSCKEAFGLGYYHEDTRLRDRRYVAVDEERGLVFAEGYFDHDATVRSYRLGNGLTNTISRTAPWTWMIAEVFQIRDGMLSQIEAVLLQVPYGMRPNWDEGMHMPSPQEQTERAAKPLS